MRWFCYSKNISSYKLGSHKLTCCFFFFGRLFLLGLWASELELKLLLWLLYEVAAASLALYEVEAAALAPYEVAVAALALYEVAGAALALYEDSLLLFEVFLEDDGISFLCIDEFFLEFEPNLACGGGIKALAEFCFYKIPKTFQISKSEYVTETIALVISSIHIHKSPLFFYHTASTRIQIF